VAETMIMVVNNFDKLPFTIDLNRMGGSSCSQQIGSGLENIQIQRSILDSMLVCEPILIIFSGIGFSASCGK
jgi:hypothetical protein